MKHNAETAATDIACSNVRQLVATAVAVNTGYTSQVKVGGATFRVSRCTAKFVYGCSSKVTLLKSFL